MFEPKQLNDYDIVPKGNWSFSQNYAPEEYFEFIYIFIMIVLYSQITKNFKKKRGLAIATMTMQMKIQLYLVFRMTQFTGC